MEGTREGIKYFGLACPLLWNDYDSVWIYKYIKGNVGTLYSEICKETLVSHTHTHTNCWPTFIPCGCWGNPTSSSAVWWKKQVEERVLKIIGGTGEREKNRQEERTRRPPTLPELQQQRGSFNFSLQPCLCVCVCVRLHDAEQSKQRSASLKQR